MRILFLILCSFFLAGFLSAQTSASSQDRIIREAADHIGAGHYTDALSTLDPLKGQKRLGVIDERFHYFSIKALYQLLLNYENLSYDNIESIRTLSEHYLAKFKIGKLAEITDIAEEINSQYPASRAAYDVWLIEQESIAFQRKQSEALASIAQFYSIRRYSKVLTEIQEARQKSFGSHQFDYYEIIAKNEMFMLTDKKDFRAIEELHRLATAYLTTNNLPDQERQIVEQIVETYPKTLDAFNAQLEKERLAAIERVRGEKLAQVHLDYYRGNYELVMKANDTFAPQSEMAASFTFFQAMSAYKQLVAKNDMYYTQIDVADISNVRSRLLGYQQLYGSSQPDNERHIGLAIIDLNRNFGTNDQQFNRLKKAALAQRQRAIKKSQRRMFVSIGYEYGDIAPYGLRFEVGGRAIGFFTTVRTSFVNSQDIRTSYGGLPNKNEVIVGPNIKLASWLFWNLGGGYGYFSHNFRDDYRGISGVKNSTFLSGYTGVTVRAGSVVNFVGGASFMDINKQYTDTFTKPEYMLGITFNVK